MSREWEGKVVAAEPIESSTSTWEPKVGDVVERCLTMRRGRVLARHSDLLWVATTGEVVPETWHINHCRPVSLTLLEAAGNLLAVYDDAQLATFGRYQPAWTAFIAAYQRAKEEEAQS